MKLGRWAFNIVAGASLVLALGAAVLWVRSYFRGDVAGINTCTRAAALREWFVYSNYGILYFGRNDVANPDHEPLPPHWLSFEPRRSFCGPVIQSRPHHFQLGPFSLGGRGRHAGFTVPHWFPAALAAVTPLLWFCRLRRRRAAARRDLLGLCPVCSYDLRATRVCCPECGTVVRDPADDVAHDAENGAEGDEQ